MTARYKKTGSYLGLFLTALFLVPLSAMSQSNSRHDGSFEVRSASTILVDDVFQLDARLQLVLSDEALDALDSGLPLTIELDIEFIRSRRFLVDSTDAALEFHYELAYHPLSQRYLVRNLNSGHQDSFATLYSALNNLGRIQNLPIIDNSVLEPDGDYRVRLRAGLALQQYSAPLRLLFFWRGQWQLESEWYEWLLER